MIHLEHIEHIYKEENLQEDIKYEAIHVSRNINKHSKFPSI